MQNGTYVVVIGASAGGLKSVTELIRQINPDINAAFFIVVHISHGSVGMYFKNTIVQACDLPVRLAENEMVIERGHVYIAPPNKHLIIKEGLIRITSGPPESRWRPSIDVMFRSAAVAYTERVIGIVLTGLLDDGAAGALAISKCGGSVLVQDTEEADYPDMPLAALEKVPSARMSKVAAMGILISETISKKIIGHLEVPPELKAEAAIAERTASDINMTSEIGGERSVFSCPDCGGALFENNEGPEPAYRCFIGHRYSQPDLMLQQQQTLESALWIAVRMMEERKAMFEKMANGDRAKGYKTLAGDYQNRANDFEKFIRVMKDLLFSMNEITS